MKTIKHLITLLCFTVLIIPFSAHAADTDIYNIAEDVKPNVLIIFDNSGSMGDNAPYDDTGTYSGTYTRDTIYERQCTSWWWIFCMGWEWVEYGGTFTDTNQDGIHDSDSWIRKGNRLNYDNLSSKRKIDIAKQAVKDVIDETWEHVRIGIMVLNGDQDRGDGGTPYAAYHKDNTVLKTSYGGTPIMDLNSETDRDTLKGYIDAQTANGYTPLANRLINAALYFQHSDSDFGDFGADRGWYAEDPGFTDPIDATDWCRENYIILMTDGLPTAEGNARLNGSDEDYGDFDYIEDWLEGKGVAANYDGDGNDPNGAAYATGGSDYLDDVAKYLFDTDLRPTIDGMQNITTYVIGFSLPTGDDDTILEQTATNGGGTYYSASSADDLSEKLISAFVDIIERSQTFTAPVVPVQRTTSGDIMYVSLFTPKSHDYFWPGYLLKLKIGDDGELLGFASGYASGSETEVTDEEGVLDENLVDPSKAPFPYWDAHNTLKNRGTARNIYTYTGTSADLNDSTNLFVEGNSAVTSAMLGTPTEGSNPRADLINYLHGADAYDEDGDSDTTEKREYILGDILHSQPLVIDYEASNPANPQRVIFVGTNDGMLHAFRDTDGAEKWAFIPPDLLPQLKDIVDGPGHQYFVDGSPKAYILDNDRDGDIETPDENGDNDRVIIIFGERRGGNCYNALDVTDPDDPQFLWRIDNSQDLHDTFGIPEADLVLSELGQSWSDPQIGKVKTGTFGSETNKIVTFIGGGFNDDSPSHTMGRGFFIIDVLTGTLVKQFTYDDRGTYSVLDDMTYCIPSTVLAVDTTYDGYINRVYVGDTGGQMWRFGFQKEDANDTGWENGNVDDWSPRLLFGTTTGSPIFYPPDLVLEPGYAYIYFGTGDRENPCATPETNRLFAVKDRNENDAVFAVRVGGEEKLIEDDLVDLTANLIQDGTPQEAIDTYTALRENDGWYITMEGTGEKILAAPVVIYGMVIFTSFVPNTDPCSYGGDGYLYIVNYLSGVAVIDFDEDSDLSKSDRSLMIGHGIPTEAVVTINSDGDTVVYVGAGGGIFRLRLTAGGRNFDLNAWREVF